MFNQIPLILCVIVTLFSSTAHAHHASLSIATWNLEWLTSQPSVSIKASQRNKRDIQQLAAHFQTLHPSVLAFQEVNDAAVMRRVVGKEYNLLLSDRSQTSHRDRQFNDINQYTGLAIHRDVPYQDVKDLRLDQTRGSKLRFAAYAILYPDSKQPIHILSVHLKAGCSAAYHSTQECQTLKAQAQRLNQWLKKREQAGDNYLILGDFNHDLTYRGDWLWSALRQGLKRAPTLATQHTQATCQTRSSKRPSQTHQFRSMIDHIIASPELGATSAQQRHFRRAAVLQYQLSDHCPVSSQITHPS